MMKKVKIFVATLLLTAIGVFAYVQNSQATQPVSYMGTCTKSACDGCCCFPGGADCGCASWTTK